jgi:hypothetical protein
MAVSNFPQIKYLSNWESTLTASLFQPASNAQTAGAV